MTTLFAMARAFHCEEGMVLCGVVGVGCGGEWGLRNWMMGVGRRYLPRVVVFVVVIVAGSKCNVVVGLDFNIMLVGGEGVMRCCWVI